MMNEVQPIVDYSIYNKRMELSLIDKLFFADKIQPDLLVDFGCADGTLIRHLKGLKPDLDVIGYDLDPNMAKYSSDEFDISTDWNFVKNEVKHWAKRPALNLSSVIHEVIHYGSRADIDEFWHKVFETGFEYIVIRDMVPSRSIDRPSHINDVTKIYRRFLGSNLLADFESAWGSIENNKNLVHFLLKYRYAEPSWSREVRENYLPIHRESLLAKIPENYDVVFHEHYVLPYIYQTVKDDTGIELKDPTHIKLILKRNSK